MSDHLIDNVGPQLRQPDPRGWLVFEHLPFDLAASEDSRAALDKERADVIAAETGWGPVRFTRAATPAEVSLLAHLGYVAALDHELKTHVSYETPGVRRRTWPALEKIYNTGGQL